eukprot:6806974-Alexandrium_andersonii.AAC.1
MSASLVGSEMCIRDRFQIYSKMGAYHNDEAKEVADELIAKAKWRASSNPKHKRDKRFRECSDFGCS